MIKNEINHRNILIAAVSLVMICDIDNWIECSNSSSASSSR